MKAAKKDATITGTAEIIYLDEPFLVQTIAFVVAVQEGSVRRVAITSGVLTRPAITPRKATLAIASIATSQIHADRCGRVTVVLLGTFIFVHADLLEIGCIVGQPNLCESSKAGRASTPEETVTVRHKCRPRIRQAVGQ